ncbi:metal ABC transporter permease [Fodinicola feengrottensis]|uniref:Metal ABC transporter permease n=1 Tax=Fodinicola feengrottensis TaxID=435914 RepID=A0ABP4VDC6_9ACTN|nr:metal ABC transporter permease [Fodinicola feengrottensis]
MSSYLVRAVLEVAMVGGLAGVVGVHVVLRRLSFFTMAMTHATFPGVVLAALIGANLYLGGAVVGLLVAFAVSALSRRQDTTAATGVVLSAGFALGVALLSAQAGFTKDLSAYLVGSVLTVQVSDLVTTGAIALVVLVVLFALHKELVFGAFDSGGMRAAGYRVGALDLLVLVLVEAVVVTAVPAVGTILSVALIVAPAAAARLWTDRIGVTTVIAVVIGVGSGLGGLLISSEANVAAGGAITLLAALAFVVSLLLSPRYGALARLLPSARVSL